MSFDDEFDAQVAAEFGNLGPATDGAEILAEDGGGAPRRNVRRRR